MDELKIFLEAIEAESRKDIDRIESQIAEEQTAMEADALRRAGEKAALWLRAESEKLENEAQLRIATAKAADRRDLLARREEYAGEVFAAVREKIAAYTKTAEYGSLLEKQLREAKSALGEGETVLYLRREDLPLGEKLKALVPDMRVAEGDFAAGGLQLSVDARRADLSFDTALRELRGRFASISGLEIRA